MRHKILIVDDEESIREFLEIMLKKEGYDVVTAADGEKALSIYKKKSFDMVISDLQMPNMDGLELLNKVKSQNPDVIFIMITAFGTTENAVEAMKLGAYDYILKPFKIDEVRLNIANALKSKAYELENRQLKKELERENNFQNFIGNSHKMHQVFELIQRVGHSQSNILITGESGTGKEMVAKAVHYNSPFKEAPFVTVNCGAIPSELVESELFGHKKGSFTGAVADKEGLFEVASGGIIFLDEVGEFPVSIQAKLLRALQEKKIRRVGDVEDIPVETRVLSATNRDLEEMIKEGTFREDLYYRLNVIPIELPPLRERKDDIVLLAKHFLKKYSERMNKNIEEINPDALALLKDYDYPGNVRELENIIERTVALEAGNEILPESLPPLVNTADGKKLISAYDIPVTEEGVYLESILSQIEKELITKAMHVSKGKRKKAAKILNITFRSMRYRSEKYNIFDETDDMDDEEEDTLPQIKESS